MRFRILGPLRLEAGPDEPVALPGAVKPRVVLGTLLARANSVVSVEDLVDEVWPSAPPRTATTTLQVYVSQVRKVLRSVGGDAWAGLETAAPGYVMRVGPGAMDAAEFEELVQRAARTADAGDPAAAAVLYRRAARLWRGPLLADLPRGMLLEQAARRLEELRVSVLEQRVRADLHLGRHREVVAELQSLVADHPVREEFHGHLMTALYRSGRQAEALEVFGALRRSTVAELGVEPGPQVRQLQARILAGDRALLRPEQDAAGTRQRPPGAAGSAGSAGGTAAERGLGDDLPAPDPLFTGRGAELDRLVSLLGTGAAGAGAVVCGAPGSGKTALAVEAAHRLGEVFPDGRLLVDLADGPAPLLPAEVVTRLAGRTPGARAGSVAELLRERRVLLILDGAVSPDQVRPLLPAVPGAAVLVTARRRSAEWGGLPVVPVGPLPPGESMLLLERAVGVAADRAAKAAREEIAAACGQLPAALRIAAGLLAGRPHRHASWLAEQVRAPGERLDRLRFGGLDVRGPLLAGYLAAEPAERRALRLLSLLPEHGFRPALAAPVLELGEREAVWALEELADAHLLEPCPPAEPEPGPETAPWTDGGGPGAEFRIPVLARLLAAERLVLEEDPEAVRAATARMAGAVVELVTAAGADGRDPVGRATLAGVVRTAFDAGLWELTVRLADCLTPLLERDAAWDDWREAHGRALLAAERTGDAAARARFLRSLGDLALQRRELVRAEQYYRQAGALAEPAGDREEYGRSLVGLAELRLDAGAVTDAAALLGRGLAAVQGPGHDRGRYEASRAMALLALRRDAPAAAAGYFAQCRELASVLADRRLEAYARRALRSVWSEAGNGVEIRPGVWLLPRAVGRRGAVVR